MNTPAAPAARLAALRALMTTYGWDAAVISGTDPHGSEYLPERWQQRQWISGFTGSYGTVVVTQDHAGLWTDTRYFIQATAQLEGTGFSLHKLRVPNAVDYPQWLASVLPQNAVVGVDGLCLTGADVQRLQDALAPLEGRIDSRPDFLSVLWTDRPALPLNPLFVLDPKYSGRSTAEKLAWLRSRMADEGCTHLLLNSLDQIAWLYNIRCHDVPFNPVAVSYALVEAPAGTAAGTKAPAGTAAAAGAPAATLFLAPEKVGKTVRGLLAQEGVSIAPYARLEAALRNLPGSARIWLDGSCLNYATYQLVTATLGASHVVDKASPVLLEKALKNPVEIAGFRQAYIKDGVALTRFFRWLEKALAAGQTVTELDASATLTSLRAQGDDSMGDSFHTISAYGANAALPHYFPTPTQCSTLQPKGLYLVDSGGQYLHGTTDITRTVPLGPLTDLEREDYTLVLKGMIALSTAVFLKGTNGTNLDILPRLPLWKAYRNYGHGTGHGIGHYLCVHEGPQDIRLAWRDQPILPGMVTSNEPGMYREGLHGVRHENVILCVPANGVGSSASASNSSAANASNGSAASASNDFGDWLAFETLTLCYIDPSPLVPELLTPEEMDWLTRYNKHVYDTLAPLLDEDERAWLRAKL